MKDFKGKVLKTGDTIVYPQRRGNSFWLSEGFVVAVIVTNGKEKLVARTLVAGVDGWHDKLVVITRADRVAIVCNSPIHE